MKKKIVIVLLAISTIICLAWLRPRVFDETLIFQPISLPEDTFSSPELRKLRREVKEDTNYWVRAESGKTIRRLIESRDLIYYCSALGFINLTIKRGERIPEEFRDKAFLRSKLVDCLKTDLNRIYYAIEKEPYGNYCYEWGNCSDHENLWSKIVFRVLKEFTFQKNKTLNQYWMKILEFERSGDRKFFVNSDLTTFSMGNFYGEYFLAICMPCVDKTVELIETISAQPNDPPNTHSPSSQGVGGR